LNALLDDTSLAMLLAPLAKNPPCGPDINGGLTYSAIREARRADQPNPGVWEKPVTKRAEWDRSESLCVASLSTESKDLNVAAWLCEAAIHRRGLAGLADGLELMLGLSNRYWDSVHPLPERGDLEFRAAPFAWLNRNLPLALQSVALAPGIGPDGRALNLAGWEAVLRAERQLAQAAATKQGRFTPPPPAPDQTLRSHFSAAAAIAPRGYFDALAHDWARCDASLGELRNMLATRLGQAAPSLSALSGALQGCAGALDDLGRLPAPEPEEEDTMEPPVSESAARQPRLPALAREAIDSRAEAYRRLADVAEYLQRTEPHSPVPYLVRRAVAWGEMPLEELLEELLDSESDLKQIFRLLGTRGK
jgi:type VI secretion system protein ImpA